MGRSGSQGFFRRPYAYAPDAQGVVGVPIPIWTSKSFCCDLGGRTPEHAF